MSGSKGLPPMLLQAVVQKGAAVAVLGGQPGKGSNQQLYPCCELLATSRRRLDVTSSPQMLTQIVGCKF
jgi:hypothetical protein